MLRTNLFRIALISCGAIATVAIAAAPADIITARQAGYKQIAKANKGIQDELKGGSPSIATIRENAKILADIGPKINTWFPAGSGPESGVKTAALPTIWSDAAGFKKQAVAFQTAATQLNAAAVKGDMAAVTAAAGTLGGTCKSCHETYRARNN